MERDRKPPKLGLSRLNRQHMRRWTQAQSKGAEPAHIAGNMRLSLFEVVCMTIGIIAEAETIALHGVRLNRMTEAQCVQHVLAEGEARRGGWVVTVNLDILRRMTLDDAYAELCQQATLHVADGMPLVWAARMQGTPLPGRVAGSSLIWSLSQAAGLCGRSVFLLGGSAGTADDAAAILKRRNAGLHIAGTYCPEFGFEQEPGSIERIRTMLVEANPDIVFVALGSPKQEHLIDQLRGDLPRTWWLGVGISFSFVSGHVKRAPKWMQHCGLEWVHRLMQEPRRLARRYLLDDLPFVFRLFGVAWGRRWSRSGRRPNIT